MNLIRYAFKNIFRNFFLSASSVLIIGLLIFFVNILLFVVYKSDQFVNSINERIAFIINFNIGNDNTQIRSQEFLDGITKSIPSATATYISQEEALQVFSKRSPDLAELIEDKKENPFPNSVRISNVPINSYDILDEHIKKYTDVVSYDAEKMKNKHLDYKSQYEHVSKIIHALKVLKIAIFVLIGLFIFTVFIVVHIVIRNFIFFLQNEIRITELVGGKSSFIYGPFVIQGIVYMISSVLLSFFVFAFIYYFVDLKNIYEPLVHDFSYFYQQLLGSFFQEKIAFSEMLSGKNIHKIGYLSIELIIGVIIGTLSALLASYKYINSTIRE